MHHEHHRKLPAPLPETFQQLRSEPQAAKAYFGDDLDDAEEIAFLDAQDADSRYMCIWKSWHGLHFLLTGNAETEDFIANDPLGSVVMGGTKTEWESSYGVVQSLTSSEVQAIADALNAIDKEQLRSRFDVAAFRSHKIYPKGDEWSDTDVKGLLGAFDRVKDFMRAAARDGEMVLISFN